MRRNNIVVLSGRILNNTFTRTLNAHRVSEVHVALETQVGCHGGSHQLIIADPDQGSMLQGALATVTGHCVHASVIGSLDSEDGLARVYVHRITLHISSTERRKAEQARHRSLPQQFEPAPGLSNCSCLCDSVAPNQVILDGVIKTGATWNLAGHSVMIIDTDKDKPGGRHQLGLKPEQRAQIIAWSKATGESVEALVWGRLYSKGQQSLVIVDQVLPHLPPEALVMKRSLQLAH